MKKLQLITAVIAFLSAFVPAKADQVVQVNVINYQWGAPTTFETVNGSFLWDVDTGTLFEASFQSTGPFTIFCDPIPQAVDIEGTLLYNVVFPATNGGFFQINYREFAPPLSAAIGSTGSTKQFLICNGNPECLAIMPPGISYSNGNGEITVTEVPEPSTGLLLIAPLPFLLICWSRRLLPRCHA